MLIIGFIFEGLCIIYAAYLLLALLFGPATHPLPKDIKWVGGFESPCSKWFAPLISIFYGRAFLEQSYYEFGKNNLVCILPGIFGNQIVLPSSYIDWLINQPDSNLSAKHAQIDAIEAAYTMLRPKVVFQPIHEDVVRRRFKNHLSGQTSDMMDDIKYAVDQVWGMNESQYKSVNLDGTIRTIIARVSNRALIGLPMCRDPGFINNAIRYVNEIPLVALMIKLLPGLLQAIVAKILTFKIRHYYTCCAQYLRPLFAERLELGHADPASLPEDYASWSVLDAIKRKQKDERTPDMLSRRLMTLNFAVIHTSTMTTSNLILDIVSAPYCIKDILKECQKLQQKFGLEWSPSRISEMATLDSALRESMRISGFGSKAFSRKVIAPNGVNLPNGVHLPRGVIVCVSGYSLHHDETIYPEPYQFSYRRFAPTATDPEADKSSREIATTTSLNYAVWGHGKHACPGRFFAVDMIKMVVAYMISHYEIKSFLKRPENVWIADTPIPPSNTFIEIRRRFENEIEIV